MTSFRLLLLCIVIGAAFAKNKYYDTSLHRERRNVREKLNNETLRITTALHEPYTMRVGDEFVGFIPDLLETLSSMLDFRYELYAVPDGRFGSMDESGKWNGMIGEVIERENYYNTKDNAALRDKGADMAAAAITMTSSREKAVNFVKAFQNIGLTVLIKKPYLDPKGDWARLYATFDIFLPMTADVYLCVVAGALVVALVLWGMNRLNPYEWGHRAELGQASQHHGEAFNLAGSLWFSFCTLQWQGYERAPRSYGSKMLTVFWFGFVTVTLVTYTGSIVNHLFWASLVHTRNPVKPPFDSLEEVVADGQYKYGTIEGGSTYEYLTKVAKGKEFDIMRHYWMSPDGKQNLVKSTAEGIAKARQGNYALILESMSGLHATNQKPCDLITLPQTFSMRSYGMAIPHNSPIMEELNNAVLIMLETGDIEALEQKWFVDQGECWNITKAEAVFNQKSKLYMTKPKRIDLKIFWGPLVALLVGIILSVLLGLAEIIFYKYKGRYQSSNRPNGAPLKLEEDM